MKKSFIAILLATILMFSFNAQAGSESTGYSEDIEHALKVLKNATNTSKKASSNKYYQQRIVMLIKEIGYSHVQLKSKNKAITFDADGRKLVLFIKKNGDLQLFFAISGGKWNHRTINEWNRKNRLSRAYLDKDSEPVLESDLMSAPGLSDEQITAFVHYFTQSSMNNFRRFLIEQSRQYEKRYSGDSYQKETTERKKVPSRRYENDRYTDETGY
ncbi:MAG: YbjN domain-containing protein [Mariprofundaceae bacterium]|nr:YbjN domain-containing protein [Mariprofundaceae bacterium]